MRSSKRVQTITAKQAHRAVRLLCDYLNDDVDLVLMADHKNSVYLIPAVQTVYSTNDRKRVGDVQFQVSEPNKRSHSSDFYDLKEAVAFFHLVQKKGWDIAKLAGLAPFSFIAAE